MLHFGIVVTQGCVHLDELVNCGCRAGWPGVIIRTMAKQLYSDQHQGTGVVAPYLFGNEYTYNLY